MKMKIEDIIVDEELYPRNRIDHFQVARMAEAFEAGAKFPPILVAAKSNKLVDGNHRLEMYRENGLTTVEVEKKTYKDDAALFIDAVHLNVGHGVSLDRYDLRRAIAKLIDLGVDVNAISEITRLPGVRVEQMIKQSAIHDGDKVALKGGLVHMRDHDLDDKQKRTVEKYGGANATFYARQIIMLLENGMAPSTPNFIDAMERLVELWQEHKTIAA